MSHNFLVKELDITFDIKDALDYLHTVETEYAHLRWDANKENLNNAKQADEQEEVSKVYGWGIQSNLPDLNVPCPPYHVHKGGSDEYRDTELVFGFINKIKSVFPQARQISLAAHPQGTKIRRHKDSSRFYKIHVPITSNDKSWFIYDEETFVLQPGKFYLINTDKEHSTYNEGESIRTHLFFKVPVEDVNDLLNISAEL